MHAGERERTLDAAENCLQSSSVAGSLPEGWKKKLFVEHRQFLDRDRNVDTTVACEFAHKPGWMTIVQKGGGMSADLWSPDAWGCNEGRKEMEVLASQLRSVAPRLTVHTRFITPKESYDRQGWPASAAG